MKLKIYLFLLLHTLTSLFGLFFYSQVAAVSINAFVLHPIIVCALYVSLLYFSPQRFLVLAVTISTIFFLLLYIGNVIAAHFWNDFISWSFLSNNYSVFINELIKFPIYIYAFLLGLVFLIYRIYSKWLSSLLNFRQNLGILSVIPILVMTFYLITYGMLPDMSEIWQTEPLFEFMTARYKVSTRSQDFTFPELTEAQAEKLANHNRPNIILIHGDALRADRLGTYGNPRETTPFIDSLVASKEGVKIPYSMSNCSESICGISSVTTSSFSYLNHVPNIFEILKNEGYIINFIGTGDLYHAGLDNYLDPVTDNFLRADLNDKYYKHDDRFVLDTLAAYPLSSTRPNLFYLRMMSTHSLGTHLEKYKRYLPVSKSLLSMILGGSAQEAHFNDHDNFTVQFDAYVKNIFSVLREKHYLDNAIVVIFADHADAIGERGHYGHYHSIYQEEIHIPIIFWASENNNMEVKTNLFATLMDIPATLLYELDLPIPENFLGLPLQIKRSEKTAHLSNKKKTIGELYQKGPQIFKLMVSKDTFENLHLFELTSDPGELSDLHASHQQLTKKMINSSQLITLWP